MQHKIIHHTHVRQHAHTQECTHTNLKELFSRNSQGEIKKYLIRCEYCYLIPYQITTERSKQDEKRQHKHTHTLALFIKPSKTCTTQPTIKCPIHFLVLYRK